MRQLKKLPCLLLYIAFLSSTSIFAQQASVPTVDTLPNTAPVENALRSAVHDSIPVSITDSLKSEIKLPIASKPLSLKAVIVPSAMIAYGALTFANKDLKKLNLAIREEVWLDRKNGKGKHLPLDDFSLIAPAVAVYALNIAGVKGKHNLVDRTILFGMSNLFGKGIVSATKRLTDVIRPDSSNRLSFPSGHTAQAFISAEFLRQEYKDVSPWIGVAGYAVAAGTGFLRLYNNKHWLNDVIAGAGVGILSTRLSYWLYPKLKNTFLNKGKSNTAIMPTYQNGAFGVGMVMNFK